LASLFDEPVDEEALRRSAPLAERLRPRTFDEVLGQPQLLGEGAALRQQIDEDRLRSVILWGPPGTGKTTIARLLAERSEARFVPFSAVLSGVKELRAACREAEAHRRHGSRTLLFIDEIHRFNKAQQDAFLPFVESGDVILVGATTENPSFSLNPALQSRTLVLRVDPLDEDAMVALCERALADDDRGYGSLGLSVAVEAMAGLVRFAAGDARRFLTALEAVVAVHPIGLDLISKEEVERVLDRPIPVHDRGGDRHFDLLSAFHKSMRNSDVDAALYYMVRMLEAGEDPLVIVRRMLAFAAEDVGTADPQALSIAHNALESVRFLGLPEGRLAMGNACVYLSLAPRSNAVLRALDAAKQAVLEDPGAEVPKALRNAPTALARSMGHGAGYVYAHDTESAVADLQCLPDSLEGRRFFVPTGRGFEAKIQQRMRQIQAAQAGEARARVEEGDSAG